jgi:internalin A
VAPLRTANTGRRVGRRGGLFISYAREDARWRQRITRMLAPSIREDGIKLWDDTRITPGTNWRAEISKAMDSAQVALLLVSPSFLASDFIADEELPPLLRAAHDDGVTVLWVLVSACMWTKTAIADFQAAHSIAKPLDSLPLARRNQELLLIAEEITNALQGRQRRAQAGGTLR